MLHKAAPSACSLHNHSFGTLELLQDKFIQKNAWLIFISITEKNCLSEISAKNEIAFRKKSGYTSIFSTSSTRTNGCQCKLGIHEETVILLYYSKFMISDFHLAISAIYRQKDQTIENGALHLITRNSLTFSMGCSK
jgi:hypothetical protein